jgi:putative restriction endonuclease
MTSWVVTIDRQHPQHWEIAKRHGFWDTTKFFPVGFGDRVYFWQAGGSMIAQCRATTSAHRITRDRTTPWEDGGSRVYRARFHFTVTSDRPQREPSWGELQSRMATVVSLQAPRAFESPADEAVLASVFG